MQRRGRGQDASQKHQQRARHAHTRGDRPHADQPLTFSPTAVAIVAEEQRRRPRARTYHRRAERSHTRGRRKRVHDVGRGGDGAVDTDSEELCTSATGGSCAGTGGCTTGMGVGTAGAGTRLRVTMQAGAVGVASARTHARASARTHGRPLLKSPSTGVIRVLAWVL